MNAMFGNLTTDGLEQAEDRIGGFQPLATDIYLGTIKAAYAGQSAKGARNVTLLVDINGREYRETIYVTNAKGENFFLNKQDPSKKVPLPGFTTIDDLCLVTTDAPLAAQPTEDKMVNIYDPDLKKEAPKSVPMLVDLLGKQAYFAIVRQLENKNEKQPDGSYAPTADTREINLIDKVFHGELKFTVVEARNGAEAPVFFDSWTERNAGQVRDKRSIKEDGGVSGRPGANRAAPQAGAQAPRKSIFAGA